MGMSKKDFETVADAMRDLYALSTDSEKVTLDRVVNKLVQRLPSCNRNFQSDVFRKRCGQCSGKS